MKEILTIISSTSGFLVLGLGFFVFLRGIKKKLNLLFLLYCLAISIWLLATSQMLRAETEEAIIFWDRIVYLGVVFIPIFVYHFGTVFVGKEKENKFIIYLGYFLAFIFLILSRTDYFISGAYKYSWGAHTQAKFFHHLFLIFFSSYLFLFFRNIYIFFQKAKKEKKKIEQIQAKYIFLSFVGFAVGSYAFLPAYGIDINPLGAYLGGILAASLLFFSITKYHLFDIRVILTEILVGVMGIVLLVQIFLAPTFNWRISTLATFLLFCIFGYYLIKATYEEERRREKAERLAIQEKALRRATEKISRLKSEFIAITSHQLRTPLTIMKCYLSNILEGDYGKLSDLLKERVKSIYQANERLIRMVNNFLNISKIETGGVTLDLEEVQIEDIVSEVVSDIIPLVKEKALYLRVKKPKDILPKISLDKEKIKEVLRNILDNAIKYTQKGGIEIGLERINNSDKVQIRVKDTGEGIKKETQERLFTLFTRGETGERYWTEGAGLGLYIAKKIIEAHKGKIWIESLGKGKGATVFLELPLK